MTLRCPILDLSQQFRQKCVTAGAHHQVHTRGSFENLLTFHLGHASKQAKLDARFCCIHFVDRSESGKHFLVGFFPDIAGIQKDKIGFRRLCRFLIPHLGQGSRNLFGIMVIHLATKRFDKKLFFHRITRNSLLS